MREGKAEEKDFGDTKARYDYGGCIWADVWRHDMLAERRQASSCNLRASNRTTSQAHNISRVTFAISAAIKDSERLKVCGIGDETMAY